MKFSDLTTDCALDAFCEIIPYIEHIMNDEELLPELKQKLDIGDDTTNAEKTAIVLSKLNVVVPIVLKKHRDDLLGVVACVNSVSIDDVKKQNIVKTMMQVRELMTDKDFMDFFKSFVVVAGGE